MTNRTGNSNRSLDICLFGIATTILFVGLIGFGLWVSPSDAEQAKLDKIATLKYETIRNAQLKRTLGMEDCVFHDLNGMSVIRCPNSNTTTHYQCGKGCFENNTVGDKK